MPTNDSLISSLKNLRLSTRLNRMESVLEKRTRNLTLVLDDIQNTHNISAVIRSADAFGIQDLHIISQNLEINRGITLGVERWLSIHKYKTATEAAEALKQQNYKLVVLQAEEPHDSKKAPTSIPITNLQFNEKLALVFGNERSGASEIMHNSADLFAHIPMYGFVESLNISVAAAICMFCSTLDSPKPRQNLSQLSDNEKSILSKTWLEADMKRGKEISKELVERCRKEI